MFFLKVIKVLQLAKVEHVVVGGHAVSLNGAARGTFDVDIVIRLLATDFALVESTLQGIGLISRLPVKAEDVFSFREEWIKNRNLIAWNFYNPKKPGELVDIIITHDASEIKSREILVGEMKIKIATSDALIKMKTNTKRVQDEQDIIALRKLQK